MKILFITIAGVLFYTQVSACILGRFGKDCPNRYKEQDNQINIYNGGITGPPSASASNTNQDGGFLRKQDAGDKSKNQGYADYTEHFLYYTYEAYAAPHQDGFYKSSETDNNSIAYEYAFNPFLSLKAQRTQLFFEGLKTDTSLKQEHILGMLNLRIYILNDFVVRAGIGMGQSKVEASSTDEEYAYSEEGTTEVIQFSANYLFGNESTFVGFTTTTIQGVAGDRNLGTSSYGVTAGIGL